VKEAMGSAIWSRSGSTIGHGSDQAKGKADEAQGNRVKEYVTNG
jgi:hypothetical protein